MNRIISCLKKDIVLSASIMLALVSVFLVKPDAQYANYVDYGVIAILFSLMLVVAGFQSAGLFDALTGRVCSSFKSEKSFVVLMTMVCFFTSAVVTNDIALITFVPFTLAILSSSTAKTLIFAVTAETIAANLGSLITPIGNPQNLFLYTRYSMSAKEFFSVTLPLGAICFALVLLMLMMFRTRGKINLSKPVDVKLNRNHIIIFSLLFILCILSVFEVIHYCISLIVVLLTVLVIKKDLFAKVDYNLLITFICFFVFVGNMSRIDAVYSMISKLLEGRELVFSALLSQIISNVPAATMLASFTDDSKSLILGTNIGGLGTLIASMASLISYRQICRVEKVKSAKYIGFFTIVNIVLLVFLLVIYTFVIN